jgi:hypothetical protein
VSIPGRKSKDGTVYYTVILQKIFAPDEQVILEKRYQNFFQLNQDLIQEGFTDLPQLPKKSYVGLTDLQ